MVLEPEDIELELSSKQMLDFHTSKKNRNRSTDNDLVTEMLEYIVELEQKVTDLELELKNQSHGVSVPQLGDRELDLKEEKK